MKRKKSLETSATSHYAAIIDVEQSIEPMDIDELQLLDESNEDWVLAWRKECKRTDKEGKTRIKLEKSLSSK
jgi:hypothetical protein